MMRHMVVVGVGECECVCDCGIVGGKVIMMGQIVGSVEKTQNFSI